MEIIPNDEIPELEEIAFAETLRRVLGLAADDQLSSSAGFPIAELNALDPLELIILSRRLCQLWRDSHPSLPFNPDDAALVAGRMLSRWPDSFHDCLDARSQSAPMYRMITSLVGSHHGLGGVPLFDDTVRGGKHRFLGDAILLYLQKRDALHLVDPRIRERHEWPLSSTWVTTGAARELIGTSPGTLKDLIRKGKIETKRMHRRLELVRLDARFADACARSHVVSVHMAAAILDIPRKVMMACERADVWKTLRTSSQGLSIDAIFELKKALDRSTRHLKECVTNPARPRLLDDILRSRHIWIDCKVALIRALLSGHLPIVRSSSKGFTQIVVDLNSVMVGDLNRAVPKGFVRASFVAPALYCSVRNAYDLVRRNYLRTASDGRSVLISTSSFFRFQQSYISGEELSQQLGVGNRSVVLALKRTIPRHHMICFESPEVVFFRRADVPPLAMLASELAGPERRQRA